MARHEPHCPIERTRSGHEMHHAVVEHAIESESHDLHRGVAGHLSPRVPVRSAEGEVAIPEKVDDSTDDEGRHARGADVHVERRDEPCQGGQVGRGRGDACDACAQQFRKLFPHETAWCNPHAVTHAKPVTPALLWQLTSNGIESTSDRALRHAFRRWSRRV